MEFRNQDEDISLPSPMGYNNNNNNNNNSNPSPIRSSAFTKPPSLLSRNGNTTYVNPLDSHPPSQFQTKPISNPTISTAPATATTYHECLRNHAAALGGHVLDGCGEFMPAADDPLKCAACGCHRSFHRKDSGDSANSYHHRTAAAAAAARLPLLLPPPHAYPYPQKQQFNPSGSGGTTTESSSEERFGGSPPGAAAAAPQSVSRKRFRTKFTPEQKEKMLGFAERVGWRMQKQDEAIVEQFCSEIGVRRQVLKVWMHNNKHNIINNARKQEQHMEQAQVQQSPNDQLQS